MKKSAKFLCCLLAIIVSVSCFVGVVPEAAAVSAADYDAYRLKEENLIYASHYYSTEAMTDTPVEHTFVKVASLYPSAAVDNSNKSALCSKPYKFMELYDNWVANGKTGNLVIPCCVIDLALGGDPVEIAGAGMTLRSHFDCQPLHMLIQVATDAAATNWVTVCDAKNMQWDSISKRWYFDPIKAYQVRFLALDIDEVNINEEGDYYDAIKGDETRFTYAEVDVFTLKEGAGAETTEPTQTPTAAPTRPTLNRPTNPVGGQTTTTAPTKAPTQPATKAPTQPATKAPTQPATTGQTTTVAPTQPATQTGTVAPTDPTGTVDVTEPTGTLETTEPTGTVDPSAPTDAPTVAPTDEPTQAPTVEATEPEATDPTTDTDAEQTPDNTWIIIVAIVAAAAIAGGAIFFIIKKKRG